MTHYNNPFRDTLTSGSASSTGQQSNAIATPYATSSDLDNSASIWGASPEPRGYEAAESSVTTGSWDSPFAVSNEPVGGFETKAFSQATTSSTDAITGIAGQLRQMDRLEAGGHSITGDSAVPTSASSIAPPLPRRPPGHKQPSSTNDSAYPAEMQSPRSSVEVPLKDGPRSALLESDTAGSGEENLDLGIIKEIIQQALDDLIQAHQHETFLIKSRRSATAPRSDSPGRKNTTMTVDSAESEDSATAAFKSTFPSLSRSPSPTLSGQPARPPIPSSESAQEDEDRFEDRAHRMVDTLCYRLQQHIHLAIQTGSQSWRKEKEQGAIEFQELEKELSTAETQVQTLTSQMTEQSRLHNLDLEAASSSASELNERIELLQAELSRGQRGRPPDAVDDSGDNAWRVIVEEQTRTLDKHETVFASLVSPLSCSVCREAMNRPTTLVCGHSGCLSCVDHWMRQHSTCPICRSPISLAAPLRPTVALAEVITALKRVDDDI